MGRRFFYAHVAVAIQPNEGVLQVMGPVEYNKTCVLLIYYCTVRLIVGKVSI